MNSEHIVVDGSNIATEGRSAPSLAQLEEAVAELRRERPEAEITVIVDATFAHRIDASELPRFEEAALAGEYVHPPAGAIGRGDAFLLRIAEKVDGTVLSNDSFQEFHGEHPWLFERGRLLGGTPVPGVGWIFSPRTPVRGPKSRQAVRDSDKAKRQVSKAIAAATKEAVDPVGTERGDGKKRSAPDRKGGRAASPAAAVVNDPLTFISFIAEHPLGSEVEGKVAGYTSHGAVVMAGTTQCYVPLANLGDPAPRSAKEVLKRGESRSFVVNALDPQRRGVELALPGVGTVPGRPSEEMIAAEVKLAKRRPARRGGGAAKSAEDAKKAEAVDASARRRKKKAAAGVAAQAGGEPVAPAGTEQGVSSAEGVPASAAGAESSPRPVDGAEVSQGPQKAASPRKRTSGAQAARTSSKKVAAADQPADKAPQRRSRSTKAAKASELAQHAAPAADQPPPEGASNRAKRQAAPRRRPRAGRVEEDPPSG